MNAQPRSTHSTGTSNLAEILERVLGGGIVITGEPRTLDLMLDGAAGARISVLFANLQATLLSLTLAGRRATHSRITRRVA